MRPTYETQKDLVRERAIASKLAGRWNCDFQKLPIAYGLDFAAIRAGKIVAWVEAKRRFRDFDQYPTCFLSLQKVMAARELNRASGAPCLFVVQFNDCLAFVDVLPEGRPLVFKGRTDRGDWQDQEPIVSIRMDEFTKAEIWPAEDSKEIENA